VLEVTKPQQKVDHLIICRYGNKIEISTTLDKKVSCTRTQKSDEVAC